ncbi:PqiA/YebS family transporter subunit [Tolumonas lignilytica]|uniref:PqiA/YebS family transporter subunit n=1 Tax=Tolumonas lignilytica TaxID=1283284 RepID=UPI0009DEA941|nr:PqiA/YebS family transporter subunit [Tolumonas lignilytica]
MKRRRRSTYTLSAVQYTACHECDWLMVIPPLQAGEQAMCPRCEHKLRALPVEARLQPLVYSIAALIMLLCSNLFPFLGMLVKGIHQDMTLYQTATTLLEEEHPALALTVYLFIQVLPATCLLLICLIYSRLGHWRGKRLRKRYTLWLFRLIPWCMVEVFLIGVLVSLIKIASLADIELGYSFWAYVLFSLTMLKAFSAIDRDWLWWQQSGPIHLRTPPTPTGRAIDQNLTLCHACHGLVSLRTHHCPRCHSVLHARKPNSLQWTLALLFTSVILYIPANILPIMITESLGQQTYSTILGGVVLLWNMGSYPVALIIFIASILVPIVKMLAIGWLCWSVYAKRVHHRRGRTRLYRLTEFIGRWSMVDVFVVAILVALIRMGKLMSVYPGSAALAFAGVVILTMLSAMSFDPRLLWDNEPITPTTDLQEKEVETNRAE